MLIRYVLGYKICIKYNAKNQKKIIGFCHICVATNIVLIVNKYLLLLLTLCWFLLLLILCWFEGKKIMMYHVRTGLNYWVNLNYDIST